MMKRLLAVLLALALMLPGVALAEEDAPSYLIPNTFASVYNSCLEYVVRNGYSEGLSARDIDDLLEIYSITYTETQSSIVYYNNPDWSIEFSFYYENGVPDVYAAGNVINMVLNGYEGNARAVAEDAFILSLSTLDQSLNLKSMLEWVTYVSSTEDLCPMNGYNMVQISDGDCYQYAVFADGDDASLDAQTVGAPSAQEPVWNNAYATPSMESNRNSDKGKADKDSSNRVGSSTPVSGGSAGGGSGSFSGGLGGSIGSRTGGSIDDSAVASLPLTLLDSEGFSAALTGFSLHDRSDTDVTLHLYLDITNASGMKINLWLDDVRVDGVSMQGIGLMNLENRYMDNDYVFFAADTPQAANALRNAQVLQFTLRLQNNDGYVNLHSEPITLDLCTLNAEIPVN